MVGHEAEAEKLDLRFPCRQAGVEEGAVVAGLSRKTPILPLPRLRT